MICWWIVVTTATEEESFFLIEKAKRWDINMWSLLTWGTKDMTKHIKLFVYRVICERLDIKWPHFTYFFMSTTLHKLEACSFIHQKFDDNQQTFAGENWVPLCMLTFSKYFISEITTHWILCRKRNWECFFGICMR